VPPFVSNAFAVRNDGDVIVSLATLDALKRGYLAALTPAGQLDAAFGPASSPTPGLFQLPNKTFVYKLTAAPAPIAPVFTASTPPLTANVAVAYHYTFAASGRPAPMFSVASGSLPSGLTLDPVTGVLSGTPDTLGDSTFTIKAANGTSPAAVTPPITIHVAPTPAAPVFTAAAPPSAAKTGVAYTYTFAATGQPAPTFSIATGTLPTGLALNATTGVLSGTPTAGGVFTFRVKAANGVSPDAVTPSLTINVAAPPVFTAVTPPGAKKGSAYSYTFAASGNPAPTFSVASGSIPTGLTLNSTTGVLSGTPSAAGQFSFTVKAANGVTPNAVSNTITITVADLPVAPVFTAATPPSTATVGIPYSYTFAANGNPAPKFTAIGTLPTGLTLNATTGVLSGTPTTAHRFVFEVKAANGVKPDKITPLITITVTRAAAATAANPTLSPSAASPSAASPSAASPSAALAASPAASPAATSAPASAAAATAASALDANNDVVALLASDTAETRMYFVQRYTSDGALDPAFGTGGTSAPFPTGVLPAFIAEATDSSYYVTGNNGQSVFLAHLTSNGQFDTAFGSGGILTGPVENCSPTGGLILLSGPDIYVLAINASCGASPAILMRFHNGILDASFGTGGEVRIDSVAPIRVSGPNGGGIQPGGQVIVGLDGAVAPAANGAAVTRVNATAAGPTIEAFTQLLDDSHFAAATVAPNPAATYLGPVAAAVDGTGKTHVFARGANNHLFEFRQTASSWAAPADLTAATSGAPVIGSAPEAMFDGTALVVFALTPAGDLVEYRNDGASGTWTTTNINAVAPAGPPHVTGALDPHFAGGFLHVYGVTTGGNLVEIDHDNASGHPWNFYDLTATAGGGTTIAGAPNALVISGTPHVYTRAAGNNHLVEYVADHVGGLVWNAYDTTAAAPPAPPIGGNPIATYVNPPGVVHVYATSSDPATNGNLVEYVADHLNNRIWNEYDQSAGATGAPKPIGNLAVVLTDGTPYGIGISVPEVWETLPTGDLVAIVADHLAGRIWNVYNVTALSGGPLVSGDPTPIATGSTIQVFGLGRAAGGAATSPLSTADAHVAPNSSGVSSHWLTSLPT
jgi:hypothetical protein